MKEATKAQYHAMGDAIVDAMQKGWDAAGAAEYLIADSPSLAQKTACYSTGKLKAMVAYEGRWHVHGSWHKARNKDQGVSLERYGADVVRRMVLQQPASFHKDG